jgi:hypothetical protein
MTTDNLFLAGSVLFLVIVIYIIFKYSPRKLKQSYFQDSWKKVQSYCRDKATWPKALEEADGLLKSALKKRRFKGKSMGEKMVSAQRLFTDNDSLWYAHNLYKKVIAIDSKKRLKESEVKDALVGFRQALRDLGALPRDGSNKA